MSNRLYGRLLFRHAECLAFLHTLQNAEPRWKSIAGPASLIGTSRFGRPGTINLVAINGTVLSCHAQKAGIITCPPRCAISGVLLCRAGPHRYRSFALRRIFNLRSPRKKQSAFRAVLLTGPCYTGWVRVEQASFLSLFCIPYAKGGEPRLPRRVKIGTLLGRTSPYKCFCWKARLEVRIPLGRAPL